MPQTRARWGPPLRWGRASPPTNTPHGGYHAEFDRCWSDAMSLREDISARKIGPTEVTRIDRIPMSSC